jgi:hypothetical protein
MDTNPKDRKSIETLQNSLEKKSKEVAASLPKKGGTPVAPKKATTPPTKAKPKGDAPVSRRTPEADAAKEALRKKLQGK